MLVDGVGRGACRWSVGEAPLSGYAFLYGELGRGAVRSGAGSSLREGRVDGGGQTARGIVKVVGKVRLGGEEGHVWGGDGCYRGDGGGTL